MLKPDESQCFFNTESGRLLIDRWNIDFITDVKDCGKNKILLKTKTGSRFFLLENIFEEIQCQHTPK